MSAEKARILVADDEAAIADLVVRVMEAEGMPAKAVYGGASALREIESGAYDLAILDVMMPDLDGFEVCRRARAATDMPIVFLTAKDEDVDQIVGLSLGADDYVVKPFKPRVLAARVKARLRPRRPEGSSCIETGGVSVDPAAHEAFLHGVRLKLTPKEYRIVELLMSNPGRVFSAEEIYERVWNETAYSVENTIMVHIRRIREKIEINPNEPRYLKVVWGIGYKMEKIQPQRGL